MSNILVVEDEAHLAEGLRFNLEAEGYQVTVVDNGEAALEQFEEGKSPFDVVVLDVMLPGKDGFTVISELRQGGQFVPTLMLTARGPSGGRVEGLQRGRGRLPGEAFRFVDFDCPDSWVAATSRIGWWA